MGFSLFRFVSRPALRRFAGPLHDRVPRYAVLAALGGIIFPSAAHAIAFAVPLMLAAQVIGVALTLSAREFVPVAKRPWILLLALLVQWTALPLTGIGLARLTTNTAVSRGIAITGLSPAEITSSLVAILAGGAGELATAFMATSLALGTILTPLWLSPALGHAATVDRLALVTELAFSVTLPLLIGIALRSRFPALQAQRARSLDLSAFGVLLVVFVGAGQAHHLIFSGAILPAILLCIALQAVGYTVGSLFGLVVRAPLQIRQALLFPIGMREFGIAIAVALSVAPASAGLAGLYGVILMIGAPLVARVWRRQHPEDSSAAAAPLPQVRAKN